MYITTPPMGWNSWNTFGENINEKLVMEMADSIVEKGLDKAGYNYVVIDDCWSLKNRDENDRLVADPEKFPHGMKYLADYIHSKGLKFGMYSCCGSLTCAQYPGSYGFEYIDAKTFAEWEVDFLKYDNCYAELSCPIDLRYKRMGLALQNCGRDILFSACSWGAEDTRVWIKETGAQMWRSTVDIQDNYNSIRGLIQQELETMEYNGQGCFNDLDMLVVGMNGEGNVGFGGCTYDEYKLHFAFWCLFGSPLIIGCDIRKMSDEYLSLLTHPDLLRINQDKAYRQPFVVGYREKAEPGSARYYKNYPKDSFTLAKYLDDGKIAVGIFNLSDNPVFSYTTFISPELLGVPDRSGKYLEIKDIFTGEITECKTELFTPNALQPHSCLMYIVELKDR